MEREHLIKEIHDLAERIKTNASNNADLLLTDVAHLYEMVILLKHLPEEVTEKTAPKVEAKEEIKRKNKVGINFIKQTFVLPTL